MLDTTRQQAAQAPPATPRPPVGGAASVGARPWSLAGLEAIASVCMAVTIMLPWLRWGMSSGLLGGFTIGFSLWDVVTGRGVDSSSAWMAIFLIGAAVAVAAALYEALERPEGRVVRVVAMVGFVAALTGAALGLVVGTATLGSASRTFETTLDFGFWLGLGLATLGSGIAVAYVREPANPPRAAAGPAPLPQYQPPAFYPIYPPAPDYLGHTGYPEHVGSAPPSYGPAVYPVPGYLTPAYSGPGHLEPPTWETPPSPSGMADTSVGATQTPGRSAGHLVVVEAGVSRPFTVEPGRRLLVGRDPDAEIRVADPSVSPRHVTIERRGDQWVVQEVDATNPTRLIDQWGTSRPVHGETPVEAAQLVAGHVLISLYPNRSGGPGR